jgi:hypothetical protein
MWGPQPLASLRASTACYRDSFILPYLYWKLEKNVEGSGNCLFKGIILHLTGRTGYSRNPLIGPFCVPVDIITGILPNSYQKPYWLREFSCWDTCSDVCNCPHMLFITLSDFNNIWNVSTEFGKTSNIKCPTRTPKLRKMYKSIFKTEEERPKNNLQTNWGNDYFLICEKSPRRIIFHVTERPNFI